MLSDIQRIHIIHHLKQARSHIELHHRGGICEFFAPICESVNINYHDLKAELFASWPFYSGSVTYPVPDPSDNYNSMGVFTRTKDYWGGDYGKLRMNLLNHIIHQLEVNVVYRIDKEYKVWTMPSK